MTNILKAIHNIIHQRSFETKSNSIAKNRANSMGDALENYIKDAFAGTFGIEDEIEKMRIYNQYFSWLGSQNNPPDIMIKSGDAIEVKKIQNAQSSIALNSSYPKAELYASSPMITQDCKNCENWERKDIVYCIGNTTNENIKSLWMVYGNLYAAKHETYERIKNTISRGINSIPDVVFSDTKELGRVNQVDPLGITNLRVRGMWQIENPKKVFNYLHESQNYDFELVCIVSKDKYYAFPIEDILQLEGINIENFKIEDKLIKDPNNPARLVDIKLITYILK